MLVRTKLYTGQWPPPGGTPGLPSFGVWVKVVTVLLACAIARTHASGLVCENESCSQEFSVAEDVSVNSFVGTIGTSASTGPMPFREFFSTSSADATQAFNVNLKTGRVTTNSTLDREAVPNGYIFIVGTTNNVPVVVTVKLLDVNDNSPTFSPSLKKLEFSESAPLGAKKSLGSVSDPDLGSNRTQICEIVSGNRGNAFSLLTSGKYDIILDLTVNAQLDYETVSSYTLIIRATDGGGRTGEMTVRITILDQNDNSPIFNTSKYEVRIAENVTVGTSITQVEATDVDSGPNGRIQYSIDSKTDPEAHFKIDSQSGEVRINKPLDFETQSMFRLTLEATDDGPNKLVGYAALDVTLENINEQPANIRLVYLQGAERQGHISENTKAGTPVARISIDDPDITVDRQVDVNVTLLGGDKIFGLEITDEVLSLVVVNTPPDREVKSVYDLTIIVTDAGNPPLRASESFKVFIDDVNDNAPEFPKTTYNGEVQETAEVGTSILRVTAVDSDEGDNAKIFYAIQSSSGPQSGWFEIDSSTGVITTRTPIDCELNAQPKFVVTARDNGEPPLSGSTTVVIAVRDVNDKQPEFETSFYNARVAEDAPVGDCPIQVHATDPECGASAPVTYQMVRNGDAPPEFTVGEGDGRICIQAPGLDFERNSSYQFLVQAVDRDGLSASAVVQMTVRDVNDNSPTFEPQQYGLNVEATVALGPLLTVQGADLDSGDFGTVTYSFVNDNGNDYFQIDAGSGTISLTRSFPAGTNRVFQLQVQGTDKGGRVSEVPAQVEVSVYSGVVHPPAFTLTMYNFTVVEDVLEAVLVGQVEATVSSSSSSSGSASSSGIHYSIVYSTRSWFRIDQTTGNIYTSGPLDREANQFVLLGIRAQTTQPQVLYSTAQVNITLLDVNDNAPYFPASSVLRIEVREDTLVPDPVYIAQARDIDRGNNGSLTYRLDSHQDQPFHIDQLTGEVFLRSKLDYEVRHTYELTIVAEDQGTGGHRSSSMTLTVNVKDINDNRPVFSREVYDFYVSEDSPIGFQFGNVSAVDADSDHNGRVSYSLESSPYLSVFGIFTVQGVLSTRDKLDRESRENYTLTVIATDHGTPTPLSATAHIRIHVTDTNDNDPEFSRAEYKFSILENQPRGAHIGQVSASDRDAGDNRRLRFQFNGPQTKFTINTYSGEITTLMPLDREEQEEYSLNVFVADLGVPERSDNTVVKVQVMDENDNSPRFTGGDGYKTVVSENRPKGLQVMKMVAQDSDAGENGTVTFTFDAADSDTEALTNFNIHPTSGWISTEEVLDYETRTQYRLKVVAYDNGHPRRSQSQTVVIDVEDVNDEAPLFHAREVNFYVVENVPIGSVVGEVKAKDKDSGENGRVNYYLVGGNIFSLFSVNTATGGIQTVREIDFEESSSHILSIQAVDSNAVFPRSSNISVIIHIVDINDNAPVFDNDPVFPKVRENTALGHVVHTFVATDRDSGLNGTIRYSVTSQSASGPDVSPGNYFQIDAKTGELSVAKAVDYEHVHTVTIIVKAEDSCPLPSKVLYSQVTVEVSVVDVNDNRPEFESRSQVHIFEDEPIGYPAIFIVAVDRDSNQEDSGNNVVSYSIVSGNKDGKFRLEQSSGLLTIYEALDRETRSAYVLNISAEDAGVPKMVAYQQLGVSVVDVNDNAPRFEQNIYKGRVYESTPADTRPSSTPVVTVKATDSDEGNNGNLTYSILRGIAGDKFAVDPITGVITTTKPLDREKQDSYTVTVNVKDDGYPALFDITTVVVKVLDVNDHSPVFEKALYQLQVPENQPQSFVISIVASDLDVGINADIVYTISDGNDGKFDMDSKTGQLSCQALDREAREQYTLTVTGTDSGTPRRSGSTRVAITVLDENDNSPRFSHGTYTATIAEDIAKGQTVMQVFASDPDQGSNGQVAYSLLGNDTEGYFSVNSTSGDIITSGVFDREKNASFEFLLVASDGGGSGPRNSTARIRIIVSDVNDNAPVFRKVPYKTTASQATGQGQTVLQMVADDPDAGTNGTVRYELLSSTESYTRAFFQVDPLTGQVTTKQALSQAALGYHSLLVVARDQGSPALSTTGVAEITVGDSGSPQLTFNQVEYVKEILENSPVDTTVTTVGVSPYSGSGAVTYSFASGNFHNTFKISSQTGLVQVADPALLDYESTPQLDLIVAAVAGGHHAYAKLQVNLRDENDNAPKFAQTKYVSAIWENNKPQTFVTQVWAKDADSGRNGMIDYTIIKGNTDNVFEIVPSHTGIVRTNINVPRLDREIQSSYTLVIEAQDYGFPFKTSTCSLHITIVDQNDNPPKFPTPGPGPVRVPENKQAGYVVAVVTATDVDLNPVLVYDFTSQGNPDGAFSIDRSSGTILLATSLDHETRAHYTLGLQVTDGQHTVSTTLVVEVDDVNDNTPRFSQQSYQAAIPENTPAGKSVLTLLATDADSGANAGVTYSLAAASLPSFAIDSNNGTIYTNQSMRSSSAESVVQVVVVARDGGTPPLSTMVAVQIHVTDINNYSPRFLRDSYSAQVKESLQKGTEILQVSAMDRDYSHRNDNVHYVLSGASAATFYIQTNTGKILLNGPLDHERTGRYHLRAMAIDRGTPPRNATVPITIEVLDENDSPPVFHRGHFFVSLREDYPLQQIFLTVNATDADEGANADLEYSITSGNSDGVFYNYKSGGLFVLTPLDYEARQSHRLIVRAVDCASCGEGVPRLSAFVTVDVNVTDVNEFEPQFPVSHYYQTVSENLQANLTVFQVHANDKDGGEYGVVTYTILPSGDHELFGINSTTGDVVTKTMFDYENPAERKVYTLDIQAADVDHRKDNVSVTIMVTDEDEYTPQFLNKSYSFKVPGSAKAGAYVGTITATDRDAGAAGRLVYTFDYLMDYFRIHPVTGNITVTHTLHEDIPEEKDGSQPRRKKRSLQKGSETVIVRVSSGMENSRSDIVFCVINIDRTCAGCHAPASPRTDTSGLSSVAIAMIVLVCILVPTIIVVLMLVFICRHRNRKGEQAAMDSRAYGGRRETLGITPPPPLDDTANPPPYKDVLQQYNNHHGRPANITSSDLSEQSNNSASSGRGSAEVEDEDEEIRMINDSNYLTNAAGYRHKTMPDSGIQQDDDTLSEPSATNHQEYLARLGIDTSKIGKSGGKAASSKGSTTGSGTGDIAFSVESMHQFSDEGGGEGGVDLDRFTDTDVDEEMVMIENSRHHHLQAMAMIPAGGLSFQAPDPQQAGTLSNVVNSEEEYSGSYNWDYLLDWGPQYQPLAHVFAEIAKLKDESVTPKKTPVKTVPQRRINGAQGLAMPQTRIVPPPIITNAPPAVALDSGGGDEGSRGSGSHRQKGEPRSGHSHKSSSSSTGSRSHSQRTSAMNSSLPSLPRSPISYESSYTSPALTPSFTPSLSPLGAHTPSISPAVSGHTSGHASNHSGPASSHSGHHHPHPHQHPPPLPGKSVSNHHYHQPHRQHHSLHNSHSLAPVHNNINNPSTNNARLTLSASSDSEREFRI
ncbi:hypothetical protein ACOMHN_043803 [Nucella lapillus]